ncbi:putative ribonuclease H-like domain-containing protein, partial [Tanacetum coccineum]
NKPTIEGNGPKWVFDIDSLTQSMNYISVVADASYFDSPSKDVGNGEPKSAADDQKQVEDGPDNENDEKDKSEDDSSPKESAFLYGTIKEEVYVTQPPRFKDPDNPNKVYKVVKALYGLRQAPRAWITCTPEGRWNIISQDKYVAEILKKFNYTNVKSASTLVDLEKPLVKDGDADDVDISRDSPFELVAYNDSDYGRATQDRKSTTRDC